MQEKNENNTDISVRIKQVIDYLGLNPNKFGRKLGYPRSQTIYDMLDKKAKPSSKFFDKFRDSEFSEIISIDWLLTGIGTMLKPEANKKEKDFESDSNDQFEHRQFQEAPSVSYSRGEKIIVATQDQLGNATVPMVNIKAGANYLTGYQSQEYFQHLDYMILPEWMTRGRQTLFYQVKGDSMEPTYFDSQWVQGAFVEQGDWGYINDGEAYIVLSDSRGLQLKRIKNRLKEGFLRCRSDNRAHGPFNLYLDDILQIWRVEGYYTRYMPNLNETLYNKIDHIEEQNSDLRLMYEELLQKNLEMQKQLNDLRRQLPPQPNK